MNPLSPPSIYSSRKSVSCPLAVLFFFSFSFSSYYFVLPSLFFLFYTVYCSSRLSQAFPSFSKCLLLFPSFFLFLIPSTFPLSLWCSPLVQSLKEGEAEEGMNANFISTVTSAERGERKCHSSEEMRWPFNCVDVYVSAYISVEKIRVTVWLTFCVVYSTCLAPLQSKWYMCIYRCALFLCRGQMLMHVRMRLCSVFLFFFVWCKSGFLPLLCFSSQSSVPLTFSSFLCSLSSPLTHVGIVITFGALVRERRGAWWVERGGGVGEFEVNVGKRKKKAFVCVPNYHSSQPKVTFAENGHTHSQNSYFYPASSVCVCVMVTVVMR